MVPANHNGNCRRLHLFGPIVHRLGYYTVTVVRGVRFPLGPPRSVVIRVKKARIIRKARFNVSSILQVWVLSAGIFLKSAFSKSILFLLEKKRTLNYFSPVSLVVKQHPCNVKSVDSIPTPGTKKRCIKGSPWRYDSLQKSYLSKALSGCVHDLGSCGPGSNPGRETNLAFIYFCTDMIVERVLFR